MALASAARNRYDRHARGKLPERMTKVRCSERSGCHVRIFEDTTLRAVLRKGTGAALGQIRIDRLLVSLQSFSRYKSASPCVHHAGRHDERVRLVTIPAHLSSSKLCPIKYPHPSLSTVSLEWPFAYALDT